MNKGSAIDSWPRSISPGPEDNISTGPDSSSEGLSGQTEVRGKEGIDVVVLDATPAATKDDRLHQLKKLLAKVPTGDSLYEVDSMTGCTS